MGDITKPSYQQTLCPAHLIYKVSKLLITFNKNKFVYVGGILYLCPCQWLITETGQISYMYLRGYTPLRL